MQVEFIDSLKVNEDVDDWLRSSTIEDISLAIELGRPMVDTVKSMAKSMMEKNVAAPPIHKSTPLQRPAAVCTMSSVGRGVLGEKQVELILIQRFGTIANITNTTKRTKSGDITLFIQHRKIVIEVKNYTSAVPKSGVDKFHRDLDVTNAHGGVFISYGPISNITKDFRLKYETVGGTTLPCAYVVCKDPNMILAAVSMISDIIAARNHIADQIHNNDTMIGRVYDLAEQLDNISRSRDDIQNIIGDTTSKLIKLSAGLIASETNIRRITDDMRSDLYQAAVSHDIIGALGSIPAYIKYPAGLKSLCSELVTLISSDNTKLCDQKWDIAAKNIKHIQSGICIEFMAARIRCAVPRPRVSQHLLIKSLDMFEKKVNIDSAYLHIDLDQTTRGFIHMLIGVTFDGDSTSVNPPPEAHQ